MKKNKVFKIVIILLLVILTIAVTMIKNVKAAYTIHGTTYNEKGGFYNEVFQNKGSALFDIGWNDVDNKYYESGSANDYQDYISGSKDGYCLNEKTSDGTSYLYVAALVDIEGGEIKITTNNYEEGVVVEDYNKIAADFAKAVCYKYNYPDQISFGSNTNKSWVANWVQKWGWHKFYPYLEDYLTEREYNALAPGGDKNGNYNLDPDYDKIVKADSYDLSELSITKDGITSIENSSYTFNNKTYQTKIGKYNIEGCSGLEYKITVVDADNKEYNNCTFKNNYIYVEDKIQKDIKSVKITQSYEGYRAKLIILGTGDKQARMIAYGEEATISKTVSIDEVIYVKTDVSLEKYITKVVDKNGNEISLSERTDLTSRRYTMAHPDMTEEEGAKKKVRYNYTDNKEISATDVYKNSNRVMIDPGDTVTYIVRVYNNSENTPTSNVTVVDQLSYYTDESGVKRPFGTILSVKKGDRDITDSITYVNNYKIKWDTGRINAKGAVYYYITVKYDKYTTTSGMTNKAWISSSTQQNEENYRTLDADYVQIRKTNVSLQKYIIAVNGNNLTQEDTNLINRRDKFTKSDEDNNNVKSDIWKDSNNNVISSVADENGRLYKWSDYVSVDVGDVVTYRITVYNNSSTKAEQILIRDIMTKDSTLGTPYGEFLSVVNEESPDSAVDYTVNNNVINWTVKDLHGKSSINYLVTIRYNEHYPISGARMANTAEIKETVPFNTTEYRTRDVDYVRMKQYAVSLEKYVSQVNGKNLEGVNGGIISQRPGKAEYLTAETYVDNTSTDTEWTRHNTYKYDNCVTVSNGDKVTYTIKVRNDGSARNYGDIYFTQITDYLPDGVIYKGITYNGTQYNVQTDNANVLTNLSDVLVKPGESAELIVEVDVIEPNLSLNVLKNVAEITEIKNRNGVTINDTTPYNNKDADYIILNPESEVEQQTIDYAVEKIWDDNNSTSRPTSVTVQLYRNNELQSGKDIILDSTNSWKGTWIDLDKYDSNGHEYVYSVREKEIPTGYKVSYNTSTTKTIITNKIEETTQLVQTSRTVKKVWINAKGDVFVPTEGEVKVQLYRNSESYGEEIILDNSNNWTYTWSNTLSKYDSNGNEYVYTIKEINPIEGYITTYSFDNDTFIITNKGVADEPKLGIISGYVWNEELNKEQNVYNGLYDNSEKSMEGIEVILYREGEGNPVAVTTTNGNGYYVFSDIDLVPNEELAAYEKYIKAEKNADNNRWKGNFYSYYVVFEYDGILYTSTTPYNSINSKKMDELLDSNAKEDNTDGKSGLTQRKDFNKNFETINNESSIEYDTKNEVGYIPQSIHKQSAAIQASTEKINISAFYEDEDGETKLKHTNLGLKDKDIFDLELTSDVDNIAVKINNIIGVYKYSNKVTLRGEDLNSNIYVDSYDQNIRDLDDENLNEIIVTYKVTIANTSPTVGTATKITNYYDDKYEFIEAADSQGNTLTNDVGEAGDGYNSRIITTSATPLKNDEKMEIYLVYRLDLSHGALNGLDINNPIPTYNITEITEYKTFDGESDKYTRGLIDKDSAPGSINKEQVRLTTTEEQKTPTTGGNPTTVKYYFDSKLEDNKKDPDYLRRFKYEDDTYATPTIYFVKTNDTRIITGTVFEDITKVQPNTRIKTGNGKLDEGEVGVFGVKVELIEQKENGAKYETSSDEYGKFEFRDFLPGNYIIRYTYGDTTDTVLLNKSNAKSYNGEDFQATNNYADVDGMETNKLNDTADYWYVFNEQDGISTAKDDGSRREVVSENATNFTDEKMTVLNNMRKGRSADEAAAGGVTVEDIIDETYMYAETKKMLLELEEPEKVIKKDEDSGNTIQVVESSNRYKSEYKIDNMNFGIAEVPVTIVDLQKHVDSFIITDASGKNTIASMHKDAENKWVIKGDVLPDLNDKVDVSIENEKLQGARLEVTYEISLDLNKEVNFDGTENVVPTITGIVDFVNNNLSYNSSLGNNEPYWEVTTYDNIKALFAAQKWNSGTIPQGVVNPDGTAYATIVKAKDDNPLLNTTSGKGTATITLERVLSSTDLTLDQIITSTVDTFEYANIVEITGFNYGNNPGETVYRDRVRNTEKFVILPGVQYDFATSETIAIHPPTGTNAIDIMYYIVAVIALGILAAGVYGIKKFVVKK